MVRRRERWGERGRARVEKERWRERGGEKWNDRGKKNIEKKYEILYYYLN